MTNRLTFERGKNQSQIVCCVQKWFGFRKKDFHTSILVSFDAVIKLIVNDHHYRAELDLLKYQPPDGAVVILVFHVI